MLGKEIWLEIILDERPWLHMWFVGLASPKLDKDRHNFPRQAPTRDVQLFLSITEGVKCGASSNATLCHLGPKTLCFTLGRNHLKR
jgi:hypothetical protein